MLHATCLVLGLLVFAGCGSGERGDQNPLEASDTELLTTSAPNPTGDVPCRKTTSPRGFPGPTLQFATATGSHKQWSLPAGPNGASVELDVLQRPDTRASRVEIIIAPANRPDPKSWQRVLLVRKNWEPGHHQLWVRWDGKDAHGVAARPGRYRVTARVTAESLRQTACPSGASSRADHAAQSLETIGLGTFVRKN